MASEVDDFFSSTTEDDAGERIDTSRPRPAIDTTTEPEIEDPHREETVVGRAAQAARRPRPRPDRYSSNGVEDDGNLFEAQSFEDRGGVRVLDDDREAARRDRQAQIADQDEAQRVAAESGAGAHREGDLVFFAAQGQDRDAIGESRYTDDEEDLDNDAFFHQVGISSSADSAAGDDTHLASGEDGEDFDDGFDGDFDIESIEQGARKKRNRLRTTGLLALAALVLGGGGYLGVSFVSGLLDSTREQTQQQYAAPEWATDITEPVESGSFDELFMAAPAFTIDAAGQTYWLAAGIADVTEDELTLYDSADGEEVASVELGLEDFDYLVEFRHEGEPVVGLRTLEGITAIRADGEVTDIEFEGSLRTEGEAPLVYIDQVAHRIDFEEGLVEIEINNDLAIVAADDDLIYQVTGDGTVVTIPDGEDAEAAEVDMVAPEQGAEFTAWAGAGHGFAGAYWQTEDSGEFLGVHDVSTGEATAYVPVETNEYWEVGRGLSAAVVDRYAVSLITGEILAADPQIAGAYSHYGYTEDRRFFDSDAEDTYVYQEDSHVIGASGTTIFVRTATGDVAAYDRNDQTA